MAVDEVLSSFFTQLRAPGIERFGIVVDANGEAEARWDSIRATLAAEGYEEVPRLLDPDGMVVRATPHRPLFGAWIMPDNGSPGALEDFVARLVPVDDPLWERAAEAVDAIPEALRRFPLARRSKAHMHTWLAWQEHPGSPMGQAITKGDLDGRAAHASSYIMWLRRLMVDPVGMPPPAAPTT